jgi:hypothetical protein
MQKFTFTVDVVTDSPVTIDTQTVRSMLLSSVDGIGLYSAVKVHESETLSDQGLKVWAKRCAGISLVVPKPPKPPKAPKAVEAPKVVESELVAAIEG